MTEFSRFWSTLLRNKFTLIAIPAIAVLVTYFLVRNLPDSYRSRTRIATGIVDRPDAILNSNIPESKINQEFTNIIELILLKKTINQVSYQLILHDLASDQPYRQKSKLITELNSQQLKDVIADFSEKYNKREDLLQTDSKENNLSSLLESMKYNYESLRQKLGVYRVNNSDFIDLQFDSENAELSAFVLNTLGKELIRYYTDNLNENKNKTIAFLDSIIRQKQDTLQSKMKALQDYKIKNGILDVNDQATTLIGQIAEFETKRQEARKNMMAYESALKNIDSKFNPENRKYFESSVTELNQDIIATRNRLNAVNDDYIKSNFNPQVKERADSLKKILTDKINQANDKYAYSPLVSKQNLVQEKLNLEVSLEMARNSASTLSGELSRLNGKLYALVPNQATIKAIQDEIELSSKELLELSDKYNQAKLESNFTTKLKQVEMAMPGTHQPSKKIFLVILAGVVSFILCLMTIFVLFYFDNTIQNPRQLADSSRIPVIGSLNLVKEKSFDLREVWNSPSQKNAGLQQLKTLLRSVRFELDQQPGNSQVIAVTSLESGEGKTFLSLNLAFAYKMINKKVLLIDGNFSDPGISKSVKPDFFIEDMLTMPACTFPKNSMLVVAGNKGGDTSLPEFASQQIIHEKFVQLRETFDKIIIEIPALTDENKAKEWVLYADKLLAVFETGQTFKGVRKDSAEYLSGLNGKLSGWLLNKVKPGKIWHAKNTKPFAVKTEEV